MSWADDRFDTRRLGVVRLQEYAAHQLSDVRASDRIEVVGIGLLEEDVWIQLPNSAGSGQFRIAGEDVKLAVRRIRDLGPFFAARPLVLWHSHYHRDEPSKMDLDNFPTWAERGIVYHAPTKTSIHYRKPGIISSVSNVTPVE